MEKAVSDRIQKQAYEFFVQRGGIHGQAVEDWLAAERKVTASLKSRSTSRKKRGAAPVR